MLCLFVSDQTTAYALVICYCHQTIIILMKKESTDPVSLILSGRKETCRVTFSLCPCSSKLCQVRLTILEFPSKQSVIGSKAVRPVIMSSEESILLMYKYTDRDSNTSWRKAQQCISYYMKEWWLLNSESTFSIPAALYNGSFLDLEHELHFG